MVESSLVLDSRERSRRPISPCRSSNGTASSGSSDGCPSSNERSSCVHFYLGRPLTEAAGILDIPVGTAKARLYRGLQALRDAMGAEPEARSARPGCRPHERPAPRATPRRRARRHRGRHVPDRLAPDIASRPAAPGSVRAGWRSSRASHASPLRGRRRSPTLRLAGVMALIGLILALVVGGAVVGASLLPSPAVLRGDPPYLTQVLRPRISGRGPCDPRRRPSDGRPRAGSLLCHEYGPVRVALRPSPRALPWRSGLGTRPV